MINNRKGSVTARTVLLLLANAGFLIWVLTARADAANPRPASLSGSPTGTAASAYEDAPESGLYIPELEEEYDVPAAPDSVSAPDAPSAPAADKPASFTPDETLNLEMFDWYENNVRYNWFPSNAEQITNVGDILGEWKGWVKYDPNDEHGMSGDFLLYLDIDTGQNNMAATCRWYWTHYHRDPQGSYDDGQSHFYGSFNDGQLYTEGPGVLHIKYFCNLEGKQYGVGMMETTDGVKAIICLMRP